MINYVELRDVQRYEGANPSLAQVPEDFYKQVGMLINTMKTEADNGRDTIKIRQYENVRRIFDTIRTKREEKIVFFAIRGIGLSNATPEEKALYDGIKGVIDNFRARILQEWGRKVFKRLRILKDVERYTGTNNNTYGPFKAGDEVSVPEEEANWLIKAGYAELLGKG